MGTLGYVVADVFTDTPLTGNQLAVFTDGREVDTETMQALAREMNFAESVFVVAAEARDADCRIRIFTPAVELPFAGYPTLGSAFVLGELLRKSVIRSETGAGIVQVELERDGPRIVFGRMEQPCPAWSVVEDPAPIFAAAGVSGSGLPVERYDLGLAHVYVELDSPERVAALKPDLVALARATDAGANFFARDGDCWKLRMFAPRQGVNEDAATGSAAGPLAVHLARHGRIALGEEIEILQGAEIDRPSKLYARADGRPEGPIRVTVGGSAVTVARGRFSLP